MWRTIRRRLQIQGYSFCFSRDCHNKRNFHYLTLPSSRQVLAVNFSNLSFARTIHVAQQLRSTTTNENDEDTIGEYTVFTRSYFGKIEGEIIKCSLNEIYPTRENFDSDHITNRIEECKSPAEILDIFCQNKQIFSIQHSMFAMSGLCSLGQVMPVESSSCDVKTFQKTLNEEALFLELLKHIEDVHSEMTIAELIPCLIYIRNLGVPSHSTVSQKVLIRVLNQLKADPAGFSLKDLLKFISYAKSTDKEHYLYYLCKDAVPPILKYLESCDNIVDLCYLTICMSRLHKLTSGDNLDLYQQIVEKITSKMGSQFESHDLLGIITFLNYNWNMENTELIRKLLLMLKTRIPAFSEVELELILNIFQTQLEPAELLPIICESATKLLIQRPSIEAIACCVMYASPEKRLELTDMLNTIILSANESVLSKPSLFRVLRFLKSPNLDVCNRYWKGVTSEIIKERSPSQTKINLTRTCKNYSYFNNNLGGTYRCEALERTLTTILMEELKNGLSSMIPSSFAKYSAFIIGYRCSSNKYEKIPEFIVDKIESMAVQFSANDCFQISRGLEILYNLRNQHNIPAHLSHQIYRIQNILNSCMDRHIQKPNLKLREINQVVRAFNNRKSSHYTHIFEKLMSKYEELFSRNEMHLNSRHIRNIIFNLSLSKYVIPKTFDHILNYMHKNREFVFGDTTGKFLNCFYTLGYDPSTTKVNTEDSALPDVTRVAAREINFEEFANIIHRDFQFMSGTSIVQACLALCFYRALPVSLIDRVFNIEFITRLENEINMCYNKEAHPKRILNNIMQLNRAVCFEYPEAGIPWFQQNYVEAQLSKVPVRKNRFYTDICNMLLSFVGDNRFIKMNHVTPYGYRIEFLLHMDKNKKILEPREEHAKQHEVKKFAILPLHKESFNSNNILRGFDQLRERHLEILGYRVILVDYGDWNSMYMNLPGAKLDYLREKLNIA